MDTRLVKYTILVFIIQHVLCVPIATNKHHQNVLRRSGKHSHHSRQLVNSFVDAPPIGPMESISIDLKGKASTFKNFSKTYKQTTELERPSKTEYLNYYKNPPISNELTSTLSANTSPYHSVPSLSPAQYVATTTNTNQSVSSNTSASPFTKDKDEESGSSSGDEDEEISGDNGGSFKISAKLNSNKNKLKLSSDTKKLLSQKVPILAIETGSDNVKSAHVSKKVKSKKHKRKQKTKKITNETRHNKKKQLHEYKVLPSDSLLENATSLDTDPLGDDGLVNLDLSSLANTSLQNGAGINSIELEGGHKLPTNGPVTFNLGHNARLMLDELPPPEKEEPEKGPLHSGHNHPGEHGIDHDLPQDQLVKGHEQGPLLPGHEQGPLLPGHEQGPLLPGQDHPGDFSHHDEGEGESKLGEGKFTHIQPSGPNIVEEPLQKPPVPAEINPGIPNAVTNFPNGLHIPSHHPLLSINGLPGLPPLNTPALLAEEEKACALKPPLVAGTLDCPPHSDYPYHHQETTELPAHNEEPEPIAPTGHPPTLPFEIPSHHKFESLGHNVEPELLSIIESNNQQVTSLSHEVKNIESRLGNVESIVEVLEKAVYRIEEKVDHLGSNGVRPTDIEGYVDDPVHQKTIKLKVPNKLNSPVPTFTQREEFAEEPAPPPPRARHPLLKQYFVPMTSANAFDSGAPGGGIKELDRNPNNGGLPWPVNKMVSYLLQEIQKGKNKQTLMQLQGTPHVPLPQAELAYPPKEHDIDRLEFEIGRVPQKSKFYHYDLDAPCQCENGGECNGRNDVCDCPLRFTGPRCERPVPRSALLDSIIDEMPTAENQQQQFLHTPKKTSLITLPLVISENNDDGTDSTSKTVGEVNQSKIVNLLSQFFSPDYLQRLAKREKVSTRRYVKYPLEKEK